MKDLEINIVVHMKQYAELCEEDKALVNAAKQATKHSYAPYSRFRVGAAALLANGVVVASSNQENAAFPSGICAERVALFSANSQYPDQPVKTLAIAAQNGKEFTDHPTPPCGACRQVMWESEKRYGRPMRLLLYGKLCVYEIRSVADLLPLSFDASQF